MNENSVEVAQMDAVGRLGVAIKRLAERDAEIDRLRLALEKIRWLEGVNPLAFKIALDALRGDEMNFTLAPGWTLTHIINLEPGWQVNLKDDEHVVVATGETIEEALVNADCKIADHDYLGTRISVFALRNRGEANPDGRSLVEALGLSKPKTIVRRI